MYQPLYIKGVEQGLIQSRQEFILPNDAYPILENAFVWRERIKRKQGYEFLDGDVNKSRLRRAFMTVSIGNSGASPWTFLLFSVVTPPITETNAEIQPGSVVITFGGITFTDQGNGTLTGSALGNSGTINYITSSITLIHTAGAGNAALATFNYFPSLPVMGLRKQDLDTINVQNLLAFDTVYAYTYSSGWQEYIPGFTWSGTDFNFFWSTNYYVDNSNHKIFWVTNNSGAAGDPIRYTNTTGTSWVDFTPQIDVAGNVVAQSVAILPFRGRLLLFNTMEGPNLAGSIRFPQRVRWSAIGTPFTVSAAISVSTNANAWRDDIPGQAGFLDLPTAQDIISVGFVRDNLVIYCEQSTWQLRYTGRSISPFQVERVNSELGAESTFSAVQFDTSLVGIGDKGVVECNSFESTRIDIKIPDLVFQFNNENNGPQRIHGIRDFVQRLAFWVYPYVPDDGVSTKFPNRRLVYNYENKSWAIFTDSLTTLGTFTEGLSRTWQDSTIPWSQANFQWINRPKGELSIVGGNQQGFVLYLDQQVPGDASLTITGITGNTTTATSINSINHNLQTGQIISISQIPVGTPFAQSLNNPQTGTITGATQSNPCQITSTGHGLVTGASIEIGGIVGMTQLNGNRYDIVVIDANTFNLFFQGYPVDSTNFTSYVSAGTWTYINVFYVQVVDADNFLLFKYNYATQQFDTPQLDTPGAYIGGGYIAIRDNFNITSKKFNFLDQGQMIALGFVDVLMDNTDDGAISMYVYQNYNQDEPINILPQNLNNPTGLPSSFFNSVVPTYNEGGIESDKNIKRVYCSSRGAFLTIQWTLSNAQMIGVEQESDVQIDMQILWVRPAGYHLSAGV